MAKYENIRALAKKQLQAVTESSDRWKAFLRTAAIAYNYSFPNQLLIHEQSPTATAVADIAYWNNNAGRWVKRGAHGIAVFDTRANSSRLRYLFDISDTIPRAEIPEALPWVITDQNWRPVWDKIVADNHADSIQSALLMLSTSCVAQRSAMFTTALEKAIDGSSLQWAKPDEQRQLFIQLITQSCLYMAALRCGVDTARLDLSALESVNQFDTNRITLCLGSACQQAARPLMQQIGSITREIDSVARTEKVRYYGDKQEENNNTKEVNNGVHDGERLPNPGADAERAADAGNRQVRQPAAEILARERADGVRRDAAAGNAVPASGGDGQRSTSANRADDADADAAEHRPEPADRPDGLDAVDERLAGPSRGTGDAADLQPVTQEPQAESDTTPSAFSVPISDLPPLSDELILGLLAKESSSRADNAAILEYFNEHPDLAERSAFCKHCYKQIYTYLFVDDHTVGFIRHDMYLELWEGNYLTKTAQVNLTWDARPFTVEEIGRENIHLRDESFPLVGRAVSHEEFARLLAANPKNAALSAPEVPSRQEQPEETAEPIVGEVIEEPSPFVAQVMADAERLSAEDEPYHREPITYEAPYLDNLPTAPREKFAANIAAIQKLKEIEQRVANGGSPAFEDEQKILAQYTGWGGLSDAFDPNKSAWSNEYSHREPKGQ